MNPDDLLPLIAELCEPSRVECEGASVVVPSLWSQLLDSTLRKGTTWTSGAYGSRPPSSTDVISLVDEIQRATFTEMRRHRVFSRWTGPDNARIRDTPAELLAIHACLVPHDPARAITWAFYVKGWVREAMRVLGLLAGHMSLPRDARCIDCQARDVLDTNGEGEQVLMPALRLMWRGDSIHAIWCASCGVSRHPVDLHVIAEQFV